jgi:hypothetical protein
MERQPGFGEERERILAKSPVLRALLNFREQKAEEFFRNTAMENIKVADRMNLELGERTVSLGLFALYNSASLQNIFPENVRFDAVIEVTLMLTGIGYQVGNIEELNKVRAEIDFALLSTGATRPPSDIQEMKKISSAVWAIMTTGSFWRHINDGDDAPPKPVEPTDLPDVFKRFFKDKGLE